MLEDREAMLRRLHELRSEHRDLDTVIARLESGFGDQLQMQRLKTRKLIRIAADETDKRKLVVQLTRDGQQLIAEVVPYAKQVTELTYGDFNAAERVALAFLLRRMIDGGMPTGAGTVT